MMPTAALTLIGSTDPAPVEVLHGDSTADVLLLCEHAGQAVPEVLGNLGVSQEVLDSHRGWDIGAANVARGVACALGAPLVLQHYSRLVIDCNRPTDNAQSMPTISDHQEIPGNRAIPEAERQARITEIFDPMNREIDVLFAAHPRRAAFSIHSYTPRMDGHDRPWQAGFLTRRSTKTGKALMETITGMRPDLNLALNQPYQIDDATDWFIPEYPEPMGLPHSLIEVRNDEINHADGVALWVDLLSHAIGDFMEKLP